MHKLFLCEASAELEIHLQFAAQNVWLFTEAQLEMWLAITSS